MKSIARSARFLLPILSIGLVAALTSGCSRASSDAGGSALFHPDDAPAPAPASRIAGLPDGFHDASAAMAPNANIHLVRYEVTDENFGNMRVATMMIPEGWKATQRTLWDFTAGSTPAVHLVRVESPDGKRWIELQPVVDVFWLDNLPQGFPLKLGQHIFGSTYAPNPSAQQVMGYLQVGNARGHQQDFQVTNTRPVDSQAFAQALGHPELRGEALSMHVTYTVAGARADEDFYGFLTAPADLPFDGPQGRSHEYHRTMILEHSIGALDGQLPSTYPLLLPVVTSYRPDPAYEQHVVNVQRDINQKFAEMTRQGYDRIRAAGEVSKLISTHNTELIASMDASRAQQNQAEQRRRQLPPAERHDDFDLMIRGTTILNDASAPNGNIEVSNHYSHYFSDGAGTVVGTNDASADPNIGSTGRTWTRLQ